METGQPHELNDEFIDTLRNFYTRTETDGLSICDKTETAMAYALNELAQPARSRFEPHLRSCRDCLTLVFDVRLSLEEADRRCEVSADLDAEIATSLSTAKALASDQSLPKGVNAIRSRFISYWLSPKLIAGLAACAIVFFILTTLPIEKEIVEDIDLVRKKITRPADKHEPATKIFKLNLKQEDKKSVEPDRKPAEKVKSPLTTPLEKVDLDNLRLVGVMLSGSGNIAIIKDASGKEFIISEGTRIGVNSGRVFRILGQKIIVEEQLRNANGDLIKVKKELMLDGERKSYPN